MVDHIYSVLRSFVLPVKVTFHNLLRSVMLHKLFVLKSFSQLGSIIGVDNVVAGSFG